MSGMSGLNTGEIVAETLENLLSRRGFWKESVREIVKNDFLVSTSFERGFSHKFIAGLKSLIKEMEDRQIEIPPMTEDIVLHGKKEDIKRTQATIKAKVKNNEKTEIAFKMIEAVSKAHQEFFLDSFNRKFSYRVNIPAIDHHIVIPKWEDDMYFVPVKFAPWRIVEEHFLVIEPILTAFGLWVSDQMIREEFFNRQREIPSYGLEVIIMGNEEFPRVFRTGSATARIAKEILRENGFA